METEIGTEQRGAENPKQAVGNRGSNRARYQAHQQAFGNDEADQRAAGEAERAHHGDLVAALAHRHRSRVCGDQGDHDYDDSRNHLRADEEQPKRMKLGLCHAEFGLG